MNCNCGSGQVRRQLVDARGIFCGYVCDRCEAEKSSVFRREIFFDANYEADEEVDGDDEWEGAGLN